MKGKKEKRGGPFTSILSIITTIRKKSSKKNENNNNDNFNQLFKK